MNEWTSRIRRGGGEKPRRRQFRYFLFLGGESSDSAAFRIASSWETIQLDRFLLSALAAASMASFRLLGREIEMAVWSSDRS